MSPVVPTYLTPPPDLNYISAIQEPYTFVLISLPLSSVLIPLFLLVLFFSTSSSRRTWLFALNAIIVLLGISEGILSTIVQSLLILHPQHPVSNRLLLAYMSITLYTPIIVDYILILRLSVVYPQTITKRSVRIPILAVPIVSTAVRVICVTLLMHKWYRLSNQSSALMASKAIWSRNTLIIADWSLQLFENFYCSVLFMCRLRGHKTFSSRMYREQSFTTRLRAVFYISVSNFVFPTILSIFQLVYIVHDRFVHGAIVLMVNNCVSIIGVVFCTIWCAGDIWKNNQRTDRSYLPNPHFPELDLRQSAITLSGIAPNLNTVVSGARHSFVFSNRLSLSSPRYHTSRQSIQHSDHKLVKSKSNKSSRARRTLDSDRLSGYVQVFNLRPDIENSNSADSHTPIIPPGGEVQMQIGSRSQAGLASELGHHSYRSSFTEADNTGFTSFDSGTDFDFVTPTPPPLSRQPVMRLAHSLSDLSSGVTLEVRPLESFSTMTDDQPYRHTVLGRQRLSPYPSVDSIQRLSSVPSTMVL